MIIYIASYPRSGNSWIQGIIHDKFNRLTSSVYSLANYPPINLKQQWEIKRQSYPPFNLYGLKNCHLIWHSCTGIYRNNYEPEYLYRLIMPGCLEFLTEKRRKKLAKEKEVFFIKTHELPYKQYFPGEKIIQPIRHPGSVCWSYYNLISDTKHPQESKTSLTQVIKGQVLFGSWSNYHEQWLSIANTLGEFYVPIYYEYLKENQLDYCQKLENFIGITPLNKSLTEFSELQKLNPISKREGKAYGWQSNYTQQELELLYTCHSETMKKLDYL